MLPKVHVEVCPTDCPLPSNPSTRSRTALIQNRESFWTGLRCRQTPNSLRCHVTRSVSPAAVAPCASPSVANAINVSTMTQRAYASAARSTRYVHGRIFGSDR